MYEEICEFPPKLAWEKLKLRERSNAKTQWRKLEKKYYIGVDGFQCRHCQAYVYTQPLLSGVQNRNHCPYCLWSRHVDHIRPGDRMSACKASMQPMGLSMKHKPDKYGSGGTYGELMLIHRCNDCGKLSINRIAADDQAEKLMEIYKKSFFLDGETREKLEATGIHLLLEADQRLVIDQVWGNSQI